MQNKSPQDITTFSSRGQIVIPRAFREALGIITGTRALIRIEEKGLFLKPMTAGFMRQHYGQFRGRSLLRALAKEKESERKK